MVGFAGYPLLVTGQTIGVIAMFARHAVTHETTDTLATIGDAMAQGIQRKQAEDVVRRSEAFLAAAQALSLTGSWGVEHKDGRAVVVAGLMLLSWILFGGLGGFGNDRGARTVQPTGRLGEVDA